MKDQREAFEAWLIEFKPNAILRRDGDGYISGTTENYFKCWQAALASQAQQPIVADAAYWLNCLSKVAALLEIPDDQPITSAPEVLESLLRSQAQKDVGWISVEDRLPEDTGTRYQIFAICKHAKIETKDDKSPYYNKPKIVVAQDWNIREWTDNYSFWSIIPPAPEGE